MSHPALEKRHTAVVTGAAMGIGLAASRRLAGFGMNVCMVDVDGDELAAAAAAVGAVANVPEAVTSEVVDVSDHDGVCRLRQRVEARHGPVHFLMNNAVTRVGGGALSRHEDWVRSLTVNLLGVINGVQAFVPAMLASGEPGLVVNVGSKQGITTPPGNTAYNVGKAGVKAYTEGLQHELRNIEGGRVTAHLLVPGWTTTGKREHQPGAWLPDQVVDALVDAIEAERFYIICPDNEVTPEMDRRRILWAAGDIVHDRPPLSRWHPDYRHAFEAFDPPL